MSEADFCDDSTKESNAQDQTVPETNKNFVCKICKKGFDQKSELNKHSACHSSKKHSCNVCGRSFSQRNYLNFHIKTHSNNKPQLDARPLMRYKHKKVVKTKVKNSGSRSVCDICMKSFSTKSALKNHLFIHTGQKPFKCSFCQKCFRTKGNLNDHFNIHTGYKPHKCHVCSKGFRLKQMLKVHLLSTHNIKYSSDMGEVKIKETADVSQDSLNSENGIVTQSCVDDGEKPHKCDVCGKCFRLRQSLRLHYLIHTGKRPHACPVCGRTFRLNGDMRSHVKTHKVAKPYKCEVCGIAFNNGTNLKAHVRIHTDVKPYMCVLCGEAFSRKDTLAKHLLSHGKIEDWGFDVFT